MADVIKRLRDPGEFELKQRSSVHEPDFPTAIWIHDPDLSTVEGGGVPRIYWKNDTADVVEEMTGPEKTAIDQAILDAHNDEVEASIKASGSAPPALAGLTWSAVASGLTVTVDIDTVVVADVTTVVADASLTKFLKILYIHDTTTGIDVLTVEAFEHTDGTYDALAADEVVKATLGEWSVVANGTELVVV